MATAKKAAPNPKKRDYKAERLKTKLNKQNKGGGTSAQPKKEKARTAPREANYSPDSFSIKYFWKDNGLRFLLNFFIMLICIRFTADFLKV